jgi:2-methylcitrate dehydratase PrpD
MSGQTSSATEYGAAALGLNVTRDLGAFLASFSFDDLPPAAVREGRRGVLDWMGCALAGSRHPTVGTLLSVLRDIGSAPSVTVFGSSARLGLLDGPIANGQMGHVLDFDDTHMGGVVLHASSAILPALFALCERQVVAGRDLIAAYTAGFEAGVRAGQGAPGHHSGGWHLTGTLGTIAAAAASAKLLRLDAQGHVHALGIAATQAAGMQQNRGTMCKSLHAGKAASNGLLAALLAERGFDSSDEILEGKRGFCRIYSDSERTDLILAELGRRWEITHNGHKPYACGVVLHPTIDAMIGLADHGILADDVAVVELEVNPLAVSITGVSDPKTGLKSKFSLSHTAAVAFLDRAGGIPQYSDERARAPDVVAFRDKVTVRTNNELKVDQANGVIVTSTGERFEHRVASATGTRGNPMSDDAIERKFLSNAEPVLGRERAGKVRDLVGDLENVNDVRALIELCA